MRPRRIERNENARPVLAVFAVFVAFTGFIDGVLRRRRNKSRRDKPFALRRSPLSLDRDDAKKSEKRPDCSDRRRRSQRSSKISQTASFTLFVSLPPRFATLNSNDFQHRRRDNIISTIIRKERLQSSRRLRAKRRTFDRRLTSRRSFRRIGREESATFYSDANSSPKIRAALATLPESAPK